MCELKLNDIGRKLQEVYGLTTGDSVMCSLPAPLHEFTEEEEDMVQSDAESTVYMLFSRTGKFKLIGFRGEWYNPIIVPKRKDLDIVFSSENLKEMGMIEDIGKVSDGKRLAVLNMG